MAGRAAAERAGKVSGRNADSARSTACPAFQDAEAYERKIRQQELFKQAALAKFDQDLKATLKRPLGDQWEAEEDAAKVVWQDDKLAEDAVKKNREISARLLKTKAESDVWKLKYQNNFERELKKYQKLAKKRITRADRTEAIQAVVFA